MNIFVYEFTCAQQHSPSSLHAEGWAMLSALVADLDRIDNVRTLTMIDPSLGKTCGAACFSAADEFADFHRLAGQADLTIVIAPEFDNLLAHRCAWVRDAGGRLLGCTAAAIDLTADKKLLSEHFHHHGVPTPATIADPTHFPVISKPRFGAGSQSIRLLHSRQEVTDFQSTADDVIIQEFAPGTAASVAFLMSDIEVVPLMPALQHLSHDGRFHYLGGTVPAPPQLHERAIRLAERAVRSVPGLHGFVGVDLVLGDSPEHDRVIEINPRLTTSYIGLRHLAATNLAAALLNIGNRERIGNIDWQRKLIRFRAAGQVSETALGSPGPRRGK